VGEIGPDAQFAEDEGLDRPKVVFPPNTSLTIMLDTASLQCNGSLNFDLSAVIAFG